MKIAVFVTIWAGAVPPADLAAQMMGEPLSYLKTAEGVETVELYVPEIGDVPKMDDIPPPDVIVQVDLDSEKNARALVATEQFKTLLLNKDGFLASADKINLELFEPVHYSLVDEETPPERTAQMSFVVRYYGPVRDLAAFVDFYTDKHPPLLAKFPAIRNVLCYLPLGWKSAGALTDDTIVIGNEVVFDDLAGLKVALASPQADEIMADVEHFPAWGYSSHHAMHRELVYRR